MTTNVIAIIHNNLTTLLPHPNYLMDLAVIIFYLDHRSDNFLIINNYALMYRVLKCDVIFLQTFPLEPLDLVMQYTQLLQEHVQNFKSLALIKVKIEKFKVLHSTSHTNLPYLVSIPNFRNKH